MEQKAYIPILRSILSPQALIPLLETSYGFTISRLQLIKAAILDTYRGFTGNGRYIFRIYPGQKRTFDEIKAELDFIQFLYSQGIAVSIPVASATGERILTLQAPEGERYAVLFTYTEGQPLDNDLGATRLYGNTLARIHAVADTFSQTLARTPLDLMFLLDRPLAYLEIFEHRRDDWIYLHRIAETIRYYVETLPHAIPYFGYCHGDVCKGNAHVSADGEVTFFDFDFCGLGWRVYDLATFLSGESTQIASAFLEGYQSVRTLTDEEKQAIPLFQIAQSIWMLGTRASYINEWGDIRFTDEFVDSALNQIRNTFDKHGFHKK